MKYRFSRLWKSGKKEKDSDWWEMENLSWTLWFPDSFPWENLQAMAQVWGNRERAESPGEKKVVRICRTECQRGESWPILNIPLDYSMKDQGIHVRKIIQDLRKKYSKGQLRTVPGTHTRPEILPVLTSQTGKFHNSWGIG